MVTLSVLFTEDGEMRELNHAWRGKDKPTDVLSFSALEGAEQFSPGESLGDLVISIDTARRQAEERDLTLSAELLRLMIHGTLHLFGYDHEGVPPAEAARMRRLENKLYNLLIDDPECRLIP